jgi:hypothetical protein
MKQSPTKQKKKPSSTAKANGPAWPIANRLQLAPATRHLSIENLNVPVYEQELWTSRQRQASSIHEVSYRACFKPQLPAYFIERLTREGDSVYDPFSGRGTTAIEAALLGRRVIANDVNPLSTMLTLPRLEIPDFNLIQQRLESLHTPTKAKCDIDLSMYFHSDTLREIVGLRNYLKRRRENELEDAVDRWIRMVATNRLTGHSPGFFSVYTLPPNQATLPQNQISINRKLNQKPTYRDIRALILKKTLRLHKKLSIEDRTRLREAATSARLLSNDAANTKDIPSSSVQLTVTSPPFLDVVEYANDNWLRCWFNSVDIEEITKGITMSKTIFEWSAVMSNVFDELFRITRRHGWIAFEVGEVRRGKIKLDEFVLPIGSNAGFMPAAVLVNSQRFTKTSNIWGVKNNSLGTNSNRIVLFEKP